MDKLGNTINVILFRPCLD